MQNKGTISSLKFFHGIVKFGKAAAIFLIVFTIIASFIYPNAIEIPIQYEIDKVGTTQFGNSSTNEVWLFKGEGNLKYKSSDNTKFTSMAAFNIFFKICIALASFYVYSLFDKIITTTINRKPFSHENAVRMKWLAYVFIAMGILSVTYKISGLLFLEGTFSSEIIKQESMGIQLGGYFVELLFNRGTLLGLIALLFSQILRYGVELREETALTI